MRTRNTDFQRCGLFPREEIRKRNRRGENLFGMGGKVLASFGKLQPGVVSVGSPLARKKDASKGSRIGKYIWTGKSLRTGADVRSEHSRETAQGEGASPRTGEEECVVKMGEKVRIVKTEVRATLSTGQLYSMGSAKKFEFTGRGRGWWAPRGGRDSLGTRGRASLFRVRAHQLRKKEMGPHPRWEMGYY